MNKTKRINKMCICIGILTAALIASIILNIYFSFFGFDSYLQSTDEIYIMEAGILRSSLEFKDGESCEFTYDFTNNEYAELKSRYKIESVAGSGTEFEKALRLMNEFAPRLTHESNFDNHVEMNAVSLLEYSLDNKKHGINCRNKAQILNEMCLALNLYARKVWIIPNSEYDSDCHVVNEVWDSTLNKWVMLDITNNEYWVDENGTPLSVLEIRYKGAMREFCTPAAAGDKLDNLQKLKEKHMGDFIYIMKNMVYIRYCTDNTVGESEIKYFLIPANSDTDFEPVISEASAKKPPAAER